MYSHFFKVPGVLWLLLGNALALAATPADGFLAYTGAATDLSRARALYSEQHFLRYKAGRIAERIVLYKCVDGQPFARKRVVYVDAIAPDFKLLDARDGFEEGLRSDAGGREVFYRENAREREAQKRLPVTPGLVADAGFDEFVRGNWSALMRGEDLQLDFLIPSRLATHGFKVRHVQAATLEGVPAQMFRLRLSGLLSLFVPDIEVYYSDSDKTLLRYEGLSNLRSPEGDQYKVRILFAPGDRVGSDAVAMSRAQEVVLRPCG